MTTLAALVAAAPAAGSGILTQIEHGAGTWRFVLELADPSAGAAVEWYDLTAIADPRTFTGYELTRGADAYGGRYRASVVMLDLYADDDSLAPWNADTSGTFGTHVDLGPGLLIRAGFIRVDGGVVVEWNPRFTNKVESWRDASYSRGKIRQYRVTARDMATSLVNVPLPARVEENWSDRMFHFLTNSGWRYGSAIYGAQFESDTTTPILLLAARTDVSSAITELDVICDPVGLVWYTNRLGQLVVRPRTDDTFHADAFTAGATGDEWPGSDSVEFGWWACDDVPGETHAGYAFDTPGIEPFGLDKAEANVINHVRIVTPASGTIAASTFDDDNPLSIERFDRKSMQATWIAANDVVAAQILDTRAFSQVEARPLHTALGLTNFMSGPSTLEYLGPVGIQHRNNDEALQAFADGWLRSYRELVRPRGCDVDWSLSLVIDVYQSSSGPSLLPVYNLHLVGITDWAAEFGWNNPEQIVIPTHTQYRLVNPTSAWVTTGYPGEVADAVLWSGLTADTVYTFQVRLIRIEDGIITDFSATRSITVRTDVPATPGFPDDGTVPLPPPSSGCTSPVVEWELERSADQITWTKIDDGTDIAPPWEFPFDPSAHDDDHWYRFRSREVCSGIPGLWVYSKVFVNGCNPVSQLGVAPYDDVDLVAYFPQICPPDEVTEAVSDEPATHGPAWGGVGADDDGIPVMLSFGPGVVAYGAQPLPAVDFDGPLTIACRVMLSEQPDSPRVLFGYAGLSLEVSDDGAGFAVSGNCVEVGPTVTTISGATELALDTVYDLALTHDPVAGDLILYVDGVEEADALGTVGDRYNFGLYEMSLPAASWITDCAVWDRVLAASELPGYVVANPTVTINQKAGQSDPATGSPVLFEAVFSEAVTGFAGTDVTLTGTAGATSASLSTLDNITFTVGVSGMTTNGTVIATIAASVCTATVGGLPNDASTSTDNTITWSAPTATLPAAIMALSPVGYWKLDEPSGTTATDSSGNARHGTYTGSGVTLQGAAGQFGSFADFGNAASSHVAIADNNVFSGNTASGLTIFALIKPDSVGTAGLRMIVSKFAAGQYEWAFYAHSGGGNNLTASYHEGTGGSALQSETSAILTTAWQAVVCANATPTYNNRIAMYHNSATLSPTQGGIVNNSYTNGTAQVWIGWRADSAANQYFQGGIAHLAIFAGQLNSTQIGTLTTAADNDGWF